MFYNLWGFVHIRPLLYIDSSKTDEPKFTLTANKQTSWEIAASTKAIMLTPIKLALANALLWFCRAVARLSKDN
jgi:hypothetical protein